MSVNVDESTSQEVIRSLRSPLPGIEAKYMHAFDGTFVKGSKVYSFGGDILIQRVRSLSGQGSSRHQSAIDLHLRKIRQGCIIDASDACALGKARKLQHLLRITPLPSYVPPGKFRLAHWSSGMTLVHESYKTQEMSGESTIVGDSEYLRIESSVGKASVTWSSDLRIDEAFSRLNVFSGSPITEAVGFISLSENGSSSHGEGRVADIVEYVESHPDNVCFAFVPHANFDVVWAGRQARLISSEFPFTQIGIISTRKIGDSILNRMLIETATPHVSSESARVLASMNIVVVPLQAPQEDEPI